MAGASIKFLYFHHKWERGGVRVELNADDAMGLGLMGEFDWFASVEGVMSCLRLVGPAFGYVLAGLCNSLYVNLTEETTLVTTDPSWIGAWWLGFLVIGVGQLMTFWILALFPKRLPRTPLKAHEVQSSRISGKKRERTLKGNSAIPQLF